MADAVTAASGRVQVQIKDGGFPEGRGCSICGQREFEPLRFSEKTSAEFQRLIPILQQLPTNDPVTSVASASCHPNIFYHVACLQDWMNKNTSCPLDGIAVAEHKSSLPDAKDPTTRKVIDLASRLFSKPENK